MRLLVVFLFAASFVRAQFPIIKAERPQSLMKTMSNSQCTGLNNERLHVVINKKGLCLFIDKDSAGNKIRNEVIILPKKNELNFKPNGIPQIICDKSTSPYRGRIYVCWSDTKNGKANEDVFLTHSDDQGKSWTEPALLTYYPNHKKQIDPYITLDSLTGTLYILYKSAQDHIKAGLYDLYMGISNNGGSKFEMFKLTGNTKFIKQKGITVQNGKGTDYNIIPWFINKNKYYRVVFNDSSITEYHKKNESPLMLTEKNIAFENEIKVRFTSNKDLVLSAEFTKPLDPAYKKVVFKGQSFKKGNNELLINTQHLLITKGWYILTLYYETGTVYCWITE